jgi:hypothetical protein
MYYEKEQNMCLIHMKMHNIKFQQNWWTDFGVHENIIFASFNL